MTARAFIGRVLGPAAHCLQQIAGVLKRNPLRPIEREIGLIDPAKEIAIDNRVEARTRAGADSATNTGTTTTDTPMVRPSSSRATSSMGTESDIAPNSANTA